MTPSDKKIIRFPGFERIISEEELEMRASLIGRIEGIMGTLDRIAYLSTTDLKRFWEELRRKG